jgi:DNA polymerase II small subunit/DNA polymerase delta subunit B
MVAVDSHVGSRKFVNHAGEEEMYWKKMVLGVAIGATLACVSKADEVLEEIGVILAPGNCALTTPGVPQNGCANDGAACVVNGNKGKCSTRASGCHCG